MRVSKNIWTHSCKEANGIRWWLHLPRNKCFSIEAYGFSKNIGFAIGVSVADDNESALQFRFCIPFLIGLYLTWQTNGKLWSWLAGGFMKERELSISTHDWALWIHYGKSAVQYEGSPWWSFDPLDFLFGSMKCERNELSSVGSRILIPDGFGYDQKVYDCKITCEELIRTRPRAPLWKQRFVRWEVAVDGGVPHPGKGTCEYNCGEGSLHSSSGVFGSAENAIKNFTENVLRMRKTYPL